MCRCVLHTYLDTSLVICSWVYMRFPTAVHGIASSIETVICEYARYACNFRERRRRLAVSRTASGRFSFSFLSVMETGTLYQHLEF